MNVDVVLFVVDSHNSRKLNEARKEFHKLLHEPDLHGSVMIVLCNQRPASRNEKRNAMRSKEIRYEMEIPKRIPVVDIDARNPNQLDGIINQVCQKLVQNDSTN